MREHPLRDGGLPGATVYRNPYLKTPHVTLFHHVRRNRASANDDVVLSLSSQLSVVRQSHRFCDFEKLIISKIKDAL